MSVSIFLLMSQQKFVFCFPLQTLIQAVTVWVVRPAGTQISLPTETLQPILASHNSLLPIQRRECITRMCYWRWRGGLASLGGRLDCTLSLYHTRSEGRPKSLAQGPHLELGLSQRTSTLRYFFYYNVYLPLPPELCQKFKWILPAEESVKVKIPGVYMEGWIFSNIIVIVVANES